MKVIRTVCSVVLMCTLVGAKPFLAMMGVGVQPLMAFMMMGALAATGVRAETLLAMVDGHYCWSCLDPSGCKAEGGCEAGGGCLNQVEGSDQVKEAVRWVVNRAAKVGVIQNNTIDVDIRDTCMEEKVARWNLVSGMRDHNFSMASNASSPSPRVLLASSLNPALSTTASNLGLPVTTVDHIAPQPLVATTARLLQRMGWRQVAVLTVSEEVGDQLCSATAMEDVCVVDRGLLPSGEERSKDKYTQLLSGMAEAGVNNVVVAGPGEDIARLVRNMQELNLAMDVLSLPWDGPVVGTHWEESGGGGGGLYSVIPLHHTMPEFVEDWSAKVNRTGWMYEWPMAWQVSKAVYGLLCDNCDGESDLAVRQGLQITRDPPNYRVDQLNYDSGKWIEVGVYKEGEVRWVNSSRWTSDVRDDCEQCKCVNGAWRRGVSWRWEAWVTALATVAGLGLMACFALLIFMCTQCYEVLEGSQVTTVLLLAATSITYLAVLPFCLAPGEVVCSFQSAAPALAYTLLIAVILSRSLMLATTDSDGLPGHASGCLQFILLMLMVGVEVGLVAQGVWLRELPYITSESGSRVVRVACRDRGWPWLAWMCWPGVLLFIQVIIAPAIWRSRRNYKEGVIFSLGSLACTLVTAVWVTVYIVCAEMYGSHWEDIAVCGGLVSTASLILMVIFIPKVYLMSVWKSSKEASLHLPGTATSTLHTSSTDFVRHSDLYAAIKNESSVYENHPGNRRGLPLGTLSLAGLNNMNHNSHNNHSHSHLNHNNHNSYTYDLDRNTEPDSTIRWEPFLTPQTHTSMPIHLAISTPATRL